MGCNYNGLGMGMDNLWRLSNAKTRSISPENPTGEKGRGGRAVDGAAADSAHDLGLGWKVSPFFNIAAGETSTLAEIEGPGTIQSIWFGGTSALEQSRLSILKIYWDGQEQPSVECPLGDFFGAGLGGFAQLNSLPVVVNPNRGLNCFWEMPFHKSCRITLGNLSLAPVNTYYQINYTLTEVPDNVAYFHAQFRRVNPLPYKSVYTIVDGIKGRGHYVGTYFTWGVHNNGWWGEGEIKFYMDGDTDWPTICGTGTEDYLLGSYGFLNFDTKRYDSYATSFAGFHQIIEPDGTYQSQERLGMYRWHVMDPIRFEQDLRVTIQALGWRSGGRYLALQDDIASVAYWYQTLPTASFPKLPDRDYLEII